MIAIDIDIKGVEAVEASLRDLPKTVMQAVYAKVYGLTLVLEGKVKTKLSGSVLNVRTGNLRRSIQNEMERSDNSVTGKVYSAGDVKYAAIHEFGGTTAPHVIEARNAKSLAFVTAGKTVFARKVNHPGSVIPERSFMRSSLREMSPEIQADIEQSVEKALASL